MQWVFDKRLAFGEQRVAPVAASRAAPTRWSAQDNDELIALAAREVAEALPGARDARRSSAARSIREKRATFSLAPGQPARPRTTTAVARPLPRRRLDRHRLPGTIESAVVSGHWAAQLQF